jgi:hypothetical protein
MHRFFPWSLLLAALPACTGGATILDRPDASVASIDAPVSSADAAASSDAPLDAPLDSSGGTVDYWSLEPSMVDFFVTHQRCHEVDGGTAILSVVEHVYDSCAVPGPIRATVDAPSRTIAVRGFVWLAHGPTDCHPIGTAFSREVIVRGLTEGTWHVDDGRTGFDLTVDRRDPAACTGIRPLNEGEMCYANCDCDTGLSCVPIQGDAVCASVCARPCEREGFAPELGLDCPSSNECTSALVGGFGVGTVCRPRPTDLCSTSSPCPEGMRCVADADFTSYCAWDVVLSSSTRHPCTTNADCDPGLDCVEGADLTRTCELRCTTANMPCPGLGPHACDERGICEFLGE